MWRLKRLKRNGKPLSVEDHGKNVHVSISADGSHCCGDAVDDDDDDRLGADDGDGDAVR